MGEESIRAYVLICLMLCCWRSLGEESTVAYGAGGGPGEESIAAYVSSMFTVMLLEERDRDEMVLVILLLQSMWGWDKDGPGDPAVTLYQGMD